MEKTSEWTLFSGKAWVFGDDINTDLMYPGFVHTLPEEERYLHCMSANRPGWANEVSTGDIIVAGKNFGTGSSRPAAQSLFKLGIRCVIGETINGLFLRNSINFGLPAIPVPGCTGLIKEGDIVQVELLKGLVTNTSNAQTVQGTPLPDRLLNVVQQGGLIPMLKSLGYIR